jgi:hypothetical protein
VLASRVTSSEPSATAAFPLVGRGKGQDDNAPSSLTSIHKEEIESVFYGFLGQALSSWQEEDPRRVKAATLYQDTSILLAREGAREALETRFRDFNEEDIHNFEQTRLTRAMLTILSALIADINRDEENPENNPYHFESMIRLAKNAGLSDRDIGIFLSDLDLRKTITAHPNEHLNREGVRLFRRGVAIAYLPPEKREAAMRSLVHDLLRTPLTPTRKDTNFEETYNAVEQAKIIRDGQRVAFRRLNAAVRKHYGQHVTPPDFKHPKVMPHIVLQSWHAGGDADGKPNSDRWALMHGMLSFTRAAVEDHLNDVLQAEEAIASTPAGSLTQQFETSGERLHDVRKALQDLKARFDRLEARFITTDADNNKSLIPGVEYDAIKDDFEAVYKGLHIGGLEFNGREGFERELEAIFLDLSSSLKNDQAREIMEASHFLLSQYKLTIAQIESRHTGPILATMIDNLFSNRKFLKKVDLGSAVSKKKKFTALPQDTQRDLMKQVSEKLTPPELMAEIYAANPEEIDENGHFVQNHETQRRIELIKINPRQFGMAISAEASGMSAEYQQFFAEAADVRTLLHTALPEDYKSLCNMSGSFEAYEQAESGEANIRERMLATDGGWSGGHMHIGGLIPCSDSLKLLGRPVTWLQVEAIRQNTVASIRSGIARLIKWGNGASIERGGGDSMASKRYEAQTLQEYTKKRGKPLDPNNGRDRVLLRMACFHSNTEQGRAQRVYSSTPDQVAAGLTTTIGELLGRRLELMGLVKDGTFIPQRDKLSARMHAHLNNTAYAVMQDYQDFREVSYSDSDEPVADSWAQKTGAITMTGFANKSARAASKSKGSASFTKVRAIQSNDVLRSTQTKHDGWFICGEFMRRTHTLYSGGQLSAGDIEDFMGEQWWRRSFFSRALTAAVASDMSKGFRKLGVADQWNFDRAIQVGATVKVEINAAGKKKLVFDNPDGRITPEEAYQARLFYDQALLAALTEAALGIKSRDIQGKTAFDQPLDALIQSVRPPNGGIDIVYGERIQKRWKNLKDVREQEHSALPEQVLVDLLEESPERAQESTKRLVIAGYRETLFPDIRRLLGRTSYGRRQEPAWEETLIRPPAEKFKRDEPAYGA